MRSKCGRPKRARAIVVDALRRTDASGLRIEMTDELRAHLARNPHLRYAVFDPTAAPSRKARRTNSYARPRTIETDRYIRLAVPSQGRPE